MIKYLKQTKCHLQFAGHYQQAKGEIILKSLFLWEPSGPVCSRKLTFPDMILRDFLIDCEDLANAMSDRNMWNNDCSEHPDQKGQMIVMMMIMMTILDGHLPN